MSREDEIYCASENSEMPFTTEVARQTLREAWRQGAQWADEHQPNPWISVKDKLPKKNADVFFKWHDKETKHTYTRCGYYDGEYFKSEHEIEKTRVTCWMLIPKQTKKRK